MGVGNNIKGRGAKSTMGIHNLNLRNNELSKMWTDWFEPVLNTQTPLPPPPQKKNSFQLFYLPLFNSETKKKLFFGRKILGEGVIPQPQKQKAIPLQAWTGPEGPRRLRLPDFKTIDALRW